MKYRLLAALLFLQTASAGAAELAGVFVDDSVELDGQTLLLNGLGLREKLWVDVYVGSLYLPARSDDVAEILSRPGPWRVQLDFVYKEVANDKLLEAWREGFEKNQDAATLQALRERIDVFYALFTSSALAGDRYLFDYLPPGGTRIARNGELLGVIPGEDFKDALLEIWLGNYPADKDLKKGMLGL
ncbi:MAG: chalcone isomerase family protein [Gammaproteobacteria bacterium]|nr:chalcone isomerase family protein [Gammaproteobacteria bacterium]